MLLPFNALFNVSDRSEVGVDLFAVFVADFVLKSSGVVGHDIEDAPFEGDGPAGLLGIQVVYEKLLENVDGIRLGEQRNAVFIPGEGLAGLALGCSELERMVPAIAAEMLRGELVQRDLVTNHDRLTNVLWLVDP